PDQYKDEYRERLQEVVQKKVAGEEITIAEPEKPRAQVIDLMEALKASLARGERPARGGERRAEAPAEAEGAAKRRPAARSRSDRPAARRRAHKKQAGGRGGPRLADPPPPPRPAAALTPR